MELPLANTKHERFACIVSMGKSTQKDAYVQAGYKERGAEQAACALSKNPLVASRIQFLQERQAAAVQAVTTITRERIAHELSSMAFNGHAPMIRMKAMDLLIKLMGYNEPARTEVSHMHLHIDSGLAAQLREGYAQLSAKHSPSTADATVLSNALPRHGSHDAKPVLPVLEAVHQPQDVACATIDRDPPAPTTTSSSTQQGACPTRAAPVTQRDPKF